MYVGRLLVQDATTGALQCVPEAHGLLWSNLDSCGVETTPGEVVDNPWLDIALGDDV